MANKPVLFTVDDPEVLRAVERECAERLQHICAEGVTYIPLKNRIFKPFFTTKGIGEETGLSLDLVRRIVTGMVVRSGWAPSPERRGSRCGSP